MNNYNIIEKFHKLQNHIEKTLEQKPIRVRANESSGDQNSDTDSSLENNQEFFEPLNDFSSFDDLARHLPLDHEERIILLFSKLVLYYNAGVLFEYSEETQKFKPQLIFNNGQISTSVNNSLEIQLPAISINQIIKFKNNEILKRMGLENLDPQNKMTILLFKPSSDFAFCLLSNLPDLWLREHAETLLMKMMRSITP